MEAVLGQDGRVQISRGNTTICELAAGLFDTQWSGATATPDAQQVCRALGARRAIGHRRRRRDQRAGDRHRRRTECMQAAYTFTPEQDVVLNSLHVGAEFSIAGTWRAAPGRRTNGPGQFPAEFGETGLFSGAVRLLNLEFARR